MVRKKFNLGDRVKMKKKHPCGSSEWIVTRIGMDIKIKCCGCEHQVMMPRSKFEKGIKEVITESEKG